MRISNLRYLHFVGTVSTLVALVFCLNLSAGAHYAPNESKSPRKSLVSQGSATLTASLVDPETTAKEKTATVKVSVTGVKLIDPATSGQQKARDTCIIESIAARS